LSRRFLEKFQRQENLGTRVEMPQGNKEKHRVEVEKHAWKVSGARGEGEAKGEGTAKT
jgi:hypothetical protein